MLKARWDFPKHRIEFDYNLGPQIRALIDVRCRSCGWAFGEASWPRSEDGPVAHAFLRGNPVFNRETLIWEPSKVATRHLRREKAEVEQLSESDRTRRRKWGHLQFAGDLGRRRARPARRRYISRSEFPEGDYPPVTGKIEDRDAPLWEVQLPVSISCINCSRVNEIGPLAYKKRHPFWPESLPAMDASEQPR